MSDCPSTFAHRLRWVAGGLLVACGLTVTACGSTSAPRASRPTTAPTPTVNSPHQTVNATTNSPKQAAPTLNATSLNAGSPTSGTSGADSSGPSFARIAGWYAGGTADAGWLYIRSDGASRYRSPDSVACPTCMTASAPIASLDFSLSALSSTGPGTYTASGTVTATSDPAWAAQFSPKATVGSPISLTIAAPGQLSLSVLLPNDVLLGPTAAAPGSRTPLPVLYIPSAPYGGYSGRYPTNINFSADSGNIVSNISWSSWGQQEAVGHGTWTEVDCVPSCAAGSRTPYPATLTLSNPGSGGPSPAPISSLVYRTITEVRGGPHGGSPVVVNYGSHGWNDPAFAAY